MSSDRNPKVAVCLDCLLDPLIRDYESVSTEGDMRSLRSNLQVVAKYKFEQHNVEGFSLPEWEAYLAAAIMQAAGTESIDELHKILDRDGMEDLESLAVKQLAQEYLAMDAFDADRPACLQLLRASLQRAAKRKFEERKPKILSQQEWVTLLALIMISAYSYGVDTLAEILGRDPAEDLKVLLKLGFVENVV